MLRNEQSIPVLLRLQDGQREKNVMRLLAILADCETAAGQMLNFFSDRPDCAVDSTISSTLLKIAVDEYGHGEICRAALRRFPGQNLELSGFAEELLALIRERQVGAHFIAAFNQKLESIEEVLIFFLVMDRAAQFIIKNFQDPALRRLGRKLLGDEPMHYGAGDSQIAKYHGAAAASVANLLAKWLWFAEQNFGTSASAIDALKCTQGIVREPVAAVKVRFYRALRAALRKAGVAPLCTTLDQHLQQCGIAL